MEISLTAGEDKNTHEVIFKITFSNPLDTPSILHFSNAARKAERVGLEISDEGGRLEPVEMMIINLAPKALNAERAIQVEPHSKFEYSLIGVLEKTGILRFPGASYRVTSGKPYKVSYV
jgi:hypothetical protein